MFHFCQVHNRRVLRFAHSQTKAIIADARRQWYGKAPSRHPMKLGRLSAPGVYQPGAYVSRPYVSMWVFALMLPGQMVKAAIREWRWWRYVRNPEKWSHPMRCKPGTKKGGKGK